MKPCKKNGIFTIWMFPKIGVPPKWMVYNGKPYWNGWFGGTTIFGNTHINWLAGFLQSTIFLTRNPSKFLGPQRRKRQGRTRRNWWTDPSRRTCTTEFGGKLGGCYPENIWKLTWQRKIANFGRRYHLQNGWETPLKCEFFRGVWQGWWKFNCLPLKAESQKEAGWVLEKPSLGLFLNFAGVHYTPKNEHSRTVRPLQLAVVGGWFSWKPMVGWDTGYVGRDRTI